MYSNRTSKAKESNCLFCYSFRQFYLRTSWEKCTFYRVSRLNSLESSLKIGSSNWFEEVHVRVVGGGLQSQPGVIVSPPTISCSLDYLPEVSNNRLWSQQEAFVKPPWFHFIDGGTGSWRLFYVQTKVSRYFNGVVSVFIARAHNYIFVRFFCTNHIKLLSVEIKWHVVCSYNFIYLFKTSIKKSYTNNSCFIILSSETAV